MTAADFLLRAPEPYDIAFIDPPFGRELVEPACAQLEAMHLLRPGAQVYVETAASDGPPTVPANWIPHREKSAGGVSYRLFMANCLPSPAGTATTGRHS
jgi:16S rRNA (guanine966-N2)-methyltransferase